MVKGILRLIFLTAIAGWLWLSVNGQQNQQEQHNILFINSYAMTYTWSDSLVSGVNSIFSARNDINVFIEFLDAKRFDKSQFASIYRLYKNKYRNTRFDVAMVSDNDALDFMMMYADSLIPGIPIVFCGINNPEDYHFDGTDYYGILDGIDLKEEIDLIAQVMPDVKKLYFISDTATTTSRINLNYIKRIEPGYAGKIAFSYVCGLSVDSLVNTVTTFEKGSAIALINYYQDQEGNPYNPENINLLVTKSSPVPIFMESETLLGKGIAGGIFIKGRVHGRDAARLALNFIDNKGYVPPRRITRPENRYYFDYNIIRKFNINENLLPESSVIINRPRAELLKYIKYIVALVAISGLFLLIIFILLLNTRKRKKAENIVKQKLEEIKEKNLMLEHAHMQVNEMNTELEEINEHLSHTNNALNLAIQKSQESDRLKSAFLANMSHEIRTPLNAIVGFSNLINELELSPDDKKNYCKIINSNSNQLLSIIEDILDISKIEAGQLKIYFEIFPINDLLKELMESFTQNLSDKPVTLKLNLPENTGKLLLRTDRVRFKQILTNLLSNALKFTNEGVVTMGYTLDSEKEITFFVKDTGIGIDEKNLKFVFDRFWKQDEDIELLHAGTGLGLSICKSLCDALNATIRVESVKGTGSAFYVTMGDYFYGKSENPGDSISTVNYTPYDWQNVHIAIVEDEISNQFLLSSILKNLHSNVHSFRNGKEIVDFITGNDNPGIDVILMDIKMPVMDGYEATRIIKEFKPDIPIIAQTAYALVEDIEKIKMASFDDYLIKPIKPGQLVEKIITLIFH